MKKRKILLGILLATAIFTSASCDGPDKDSDATKDVVTEQFTVTFNSMGGTEVAAQNINKDAKATEPTAPTKTATAAETYTFAGWYTDEAYTTAFDFNTGITANITLYAKWTPSAVMYTVTFNTGSGASTVPAASVAYGGTVTKPTDPTKTATAAETYTFGGWYKNQACTQEFNFTTDTITTATTLYAKWNPSPVMYTVTFDVVGGSEVSSQSIAYGGTVTKPADPQKQGDENTRYAFGGWYTTSDYLEETKFDFANDTITTATTLYAKWDLTDKFQVTFNAMGGTPDTQTQ